MSAQGLFGLPGRRRWLPFKVAILTVVVGLLLVTCAFLVGYGTAESAPSRSDGRLIAECSQAEIG